MVMASDPNTPSHSGLVNGSNGDITAAGNPYETDPELIPRDDPFLKRHVQYGRYAPRDGDFRPRYDQWWQSDPDALAYWEEIVKSSCTPENSLNVPGPREVFASGSVIIRVDRNEDVGDAGDKYSFVNANELSTARKVEETLRELGITVPVIHFCGTVDGKNVTVESRVPGVSLEVAWRYLAADQIASIKEQCRRAFSCLAGIDSNPDQPSYVCKGLNSQSPPAVEDAERGILFQEKGEDETLCLVHNNMTLSNVIVNDDRVVGISGWRQSGYFGFERASTTHRQFRMHEDSAADGVLEGTHLWADIYENIPNIRKANGIPPSKDTTVPQVKLEPLNMNLDKVPLEAMDSNSPLAQLDGTDDYPTPRNVANLKHGGSRASSSDRSSPANSIKPPGRKSTPVAAKKAPAKKPAAKKRKVNDDDNESVDGRSNTPSSTRASKPPGVKKQSSVSRANSPAVETKKKGLKRGTKKAVAEEDSEEEDENALFCICRKPDNHTWMIGCDGECEDWFHGKCVKIDPRDADLIEKYICPNCSEKGQGQTTWKPMCRLNGCRKPARFNQKNASKYCSDDHGREFMRQRTKHLLTKNSQGEDLGSRGGVLTAGELKAVVTGVSSAQEFRKLGERIISPPPEEENAVTGEKTQKKLGLDADPDGLTYSADEASKIQELRTRRDELLHRKEMLTVRGIFINLAEQRSKSVLEKLKQLEPKGGWKSLCGFDSRLAWSDEEFDEWRLSEMGKHALEEGTPEALASSYPDATDADGDTAMDGAQTNENDIATITRGVCTKKRCERHKNWNKVHQSELLFEEETLAQDLVKCEEEAQNVVERAVLRMWAEKDNAQMGIMNTLLKPEA